MVQPGHPGVCSPAEWASEKCQAVLSGLRLLNGPSIKVTWERSLHFL